jgi:hypothetical protein
VLLLYRGVLSAQQAQDEGEEGNKVEAEGEANGSIAVKLFGNNVRSISR